MFLFMLKNSKFNSVKTEFLNNFPRAYFPLGFIMSICLLNLSIQMIILERKKREVAMAVYWAVVR